MSLRRAILSTGSAVALLLLLAVAFRHAIAHEALQMALSAVTGSATSVGTFAVGGHSAELRDVRMSRSGVTVFSARRVFVHYNLRELLPGGQRRFGLSDVELDSPTVTLHRNSAGAFDLFPPRAPPAQRPAPAPPQKPLRLRVRVRDGSFVLLDPYRADPVSRKFVIDRIGGEARIDSTALTGYAVHATYEAEGAHYPMRARGRIDVMRGIALHHLSCAALPLRETANYFIEGHVASLQRGTARDVHVLLYAFETQPYHVSASLRLSAVQMAVTALRYPVRDLSGRVDVYDDGLAAPKLSATVNAIPLEIGGGLFNFADPRVAVGVRANAPLPRLRSVFAFSERQPLSGDVGVRLLFEGPVGEPLILTRLSSDDTAYRALPISRLDATVAYYRSAAMMVPFALRYGGIDVRARGAFLIGDHVATEAFVRADAPALAVPYAAQSVPSATLHVQGLLAGLDGAFATRGLVLGDGGGDELSGVFAVDAHGNGHLGPVLAMRADGSSLAAGLILQRSQSQSAFWLDARRFAMVAPRSAPRLPGLPQVVPPPLSGLLDASVAGEGPPSSFALAGHVRASALRVGDFGIDNVDGSILGSPADARLGTIRASGPWGTFAGGAALSAGQVALNGDYSGSFARLERFTGRLGAAGPIAAPVSVLVAPGRTIVQTTGANSPGASIHGVPIDGIAGTMSSEGQRIRVFAARARVASAPLAAAGGIGRGLSLGFAVARAEAHDLRPLGVPFDAGRVAAVGSASNGAGTLGFSGGAVITDGRFRTYPVAANGDLRYRGEALDFAKVEGRVATVYGSGGGTLMLAGSGAPRYDAGLRIRAADLGEAAASFGGAPYHLDGSADADLRVSGSGAAPQVSGSVELPEATVNGMFIDRVTARVSAAPSALALHDGTMVVGSTVARFDAALRRRRTLSLAVAAPHADLSDFDGFFDEGDFLSGTGRVGLSFVRRRASAATSGDVALRALRVGHLDFGDASAIWASRGSRVTGRGGFGGRLGRLELRGSVDLPTRGSVRRLLPRSHFDVQGRAANLDVGAWIQALGYDAPVGGLVDADGTLRGRFPALALSGNAALIGGTVGRLPIDRLTVSAVSSFSRTTITNADLEVGTVSVRGGGSFGYTGRQPLELRLHASSPDIGAVVAKLSGNKLPLHGSFQGDVRGAGTLSHPTLNGGVNIENASLSGVAVPRALGEFALAGRDVEVRDAEIAFATGTLYMAGSIPLTVSPPGFGPPQAPITLEVAPKGINLADFVPMLPPGSRMVGSVDGRVAIRGTVAAPRLDGQVSLAGGELLVGSFERQPLTRMSGTLSFGGTTARVDRLRADVGGGTMQISGGVSVPNLGRLATASTYDVNASLSRALLDMPAYGRGVVDGSFALRHRPAELPHVTGYVTVDDAAIPFAALYNPAAPSAGEFALQSTGNTPLGLPNVAFGLRLTAGRNVRVRSSVMDLGGTGSLLLGGTLAMPQLTGSIDSTGGTLTYFNRVFHVVEGNVSFAAGQGIVPVLDARASTHVINPDPNPERNPTGSADITLSVKGPVTNLNIALDSDPPYDRQQILGLLLSAPAVGATTLFANPALPGSPPPITYGAPGSTGAITVGQTAFSLLNAQFTRSLLSPFETSLGGALGLSDVNVTLDYTGNVGVSARKLLGKNIYAVYGTTFGYPYRQTFGFELRPTPTTAAQFTFYETIGQVYGYITSPVTGAVSRTTLSQPITGTSGFSFSFQRFFW